MSTRYNDSKKSKWLLDVDTNKVSFIRDVTSDEDARPLQTSSIIKITKEKPIVSNVLGVKLQVAPPEAGEDSKNDSLDPKTSLFLDSIEEILTQNSNENKSNYHSDDTSIKYSPSHGDNTNQMRSIPRRGQSGSIAPLAMFG